MKKLILILSIIFSNLSYAEELSVDTFFDKFNMRSTLSSMGPQLKFCCGSNHSEFFKIKENKISPFLCDKLSLCCKLIRFFLLLK